jgi:hypothetical protein
VKSWHCGAVVQVSRDILCLHHQRKFEECCVRTLYRKMSPIPVCSVSGRASELRSQLFSVPPQTL